MSLVVKYNKKEVFIMSWIIEAKLYNDSAVDFFVGKSQEIVAQNAVNMFGIIEKFIPESAVGMIVSLGKLTLESAVWYSNRVQETVYREILQNYGMLNSLEMQANKLGARIYRLVDKTKIGACFVVSGLVLSLIAYYYQNQTPKNYKTRFEQFNQIANSFNGFMKKHQAKLMGTGLALTSIGSVFIIQAHLKASRACDKLDVIRDLLVKTVNADPDRILEAAKGLNVLVSSAL